GGGGGALRALGALGPRPGALGRGDAKLFGAIGAFLGWAALPEAALAGALGGIGFALLRHRSAAAQAEIAFGPALILGALAVVLFGPVFG
ncbi:MAG: A24 family peptidase, partial [Paracoccaceae bacterium]